MKKLLLIGVLNISLLFSPPPLPGTTDPNGRYVSLNKYAGFFLNPDSYGFIFPAIHPDTLLKKDALRQSRPLFVLTGSLAGYTICFITWPFHEQLGGFYRKFWRGVYPVKDILLVGNFYLGFFLINILILWLALLFFEKIYESQVTPSKNATWVKWLLMVFICSNPVTKAFFWTVHEQMFAFFAPMFCLYLMIRYENRTIQKPFLPSCGYFFISGLFLLLYGNFLILLPCLLLGYIHKEKKPESFLIRLSLTSKLLLFTILFFLPTFLWIGFLTWKGVGYYNVEMVYYHQIIWIPESFHQSVSFFFVQWVKHSSEFLTTTKNFGLLLIVTLLLFITGNNFIPFKQTVFYNWIFVFTFFFIFYWMLGFYSERLTNTLIALILVFWIFVYNGCQRKRTFAFILTSFALIWQVYLLCSYGPYS